MKNLNKPLILKFITMKAMTYVLMSIVFTVSGQTGSASLQHYIGLKNALVQSDADGARAAAGKLVTALQQEDYLELSSLAADIAASEDLETQREQFKSLTELFIKSLKQSGVSGKVYVQYCPMAFDDTGATWISYSEEIKNPYFGDQMLHCGTVQEEL
jgi:hypothetical protein